MIIIGHRDIEFRAFERVSAKEDIKKTSSNSVIVFDFDVALCRYAKENNVSFAVFVKSEKEVLLASSLGASFIICSSIVAKVAQKFADDYLFDAKILQMIKDEDEMVDVAKNSIDGVIFEKGIKDGSS